MNHTKPLFLRAARERVLHGANRLAETNRNIHGSECTASTNVVKMHADRASDQSTVLALQRGGDHSA
jgi:hypothetical protein